MRTIPLHRAAFAGLVLLPGLLSLVRPLDHDESQYVAAAALTAKGGLPYLSYAYLQTPLQPLLFGPLVVLFGPWAWPGLRIVNALLGAAAIGLVHRAAREAGAEPRAALTAAALFACTDILLFSIGIARNDALPAALMAAALPLIVRAANGRATWWTAALAGLLLAAAGAVKISYALPAAAYGLYVLFDRRHRPFWLAAGAVPMLALVGVLFALQPLGFLFGVFRFPSLAPAEYYAALGRPWKLSWPAKAVDTLKFLALGPALPALVAVVRDRGHDPVRRVLDLLVIAGLVAALLPFPTWRQYLLPSMVPLFVRLAVAWSAQPPGRAMRIAAIVFACAGLAPSVEALLLATRGVPMVEAMRQGVAIRTAMDDAKVGQWVTTLSPQFLPATGRLPDPRFATGPFYFRSHGLIDDKAEIIDKLVSRDRVDRAFEPPLGHPPAAILVGGEGPWTSGDAALDAVLERWAAAHRYRAVPVSGDRFRLYVRPR